MGFLRVLLGGSINAEHRKQLLKYDLLSFLFFMPFIILLVISRVHSIETNSQIYSRLIVIFFIPPLLYSLYLTITRKTYWGYLAQERKEAKQQAQRSETELLTSAEAMKKKVNEQQG